MNERRIIVVTLPDQADSVLDPWNSVCWGVEDDEIEPTEAVTLGDGVLLALLQTGGGEELDGFKPVNGVLVEGLDILGVSTGQEGSIEE